MFTYSFKNTQTSHSAWLSLSRSASNDELGAINYQFEGVITDITTDAISVKNQDKIQAFKTYVTRFTTVSSLDSFEEWPSKIIVENDKSQFKVGDPVTLVVSGDRYAKADESSFVLMRVLKVNR